MEVANSISETIELNGLVIEAIPEKGVNWQKGYYPMANQFKARDVNWNFLDIKKIDILFDAMSSEHFCFIDRGIQYIVKGGIRIDLPNLTLTANSEAHQENGWVERCFFDVFQEGRKIALSKIEMCFDVNNPGFLILKTEFSPHL